MKCAVSKQSMWVCQVLIPSVETEVCFLISVSTTTPISTQHDHSWQTNTYRLGYKGWKLHSRLRHINHFVYNTLTCSELLLFSVSIGYPDASRPIPSSPLCTGRSHMHGNSRMAMIDSRSLVYTKVHPPPPVISTG